MEIKLIRHIEEDQNSTDIRDGVIDSNEIKLLEEKYIPAILENIKSGEFEKIVIISSDKSRSLQTSGLLKKGLNNLSAIPIIDEIDPRTSAQEHGKYKEGLSMENPLVKKAKSVYIKETFEKKNIWYRYGDTKDAFGNEIYPELKNVFESTGENQIELSIRMYRFFLDLIEKRKQNPKTLFVLSTHYIVMSRLLSLEYLSGKLDNFAMFSFHTNGDLYMHEWEATKDMLNGENFHEYFRVRNFIFDVDISKIDKIKFAIQSDLDVLLAKYMQHYGTTI